MRTIKSTLVDRKLDFVNSLSDPGLNHHHLKTKTIEHDREAMLIELRAALDGCGIKIPALGTEYSSSQLDHKTQEWDTIYQGGVGLE
jgi:hypothetical protein